MPRMFSRTVFVRCCDVRGPSQLDRRLHCLRGWQVQHNDGSDSSEHVFELRRWHLPCRRGHCGLGPRCCIRLRYLRGWDVQHHNGSKRVHGLRCWHLPHRRRYRSLGPRRRIRLFDLRGWDVQHFNRCAGLEHLPELSNGHVQCRRRDVGRKSRRSL